MDEDDVVVVICLRIEEHPEPPAPSLALACEGCGIGVWMSRFTYRDVFKLRGVPPRPMCPACGIAVADQLGGEPQLTPLQRKMFGPASDALARLWVREQREASS